MGVFGNTFGNALGDQQGSNLDLLGSKYLNFNGVNQIATSDDYAAFQTPNLITNWSFEQYIGTKDDGLIDTFTGWTNSNTTTITHRAVTGVHGETELLLYNDTKAANVSQIVTVLPNQDYWFRVKYKCSSDTSPARIQIKDETHSVDIIPLTGIDTTAAIYDIYATAFTVPPECTQIKIILFTSSASGQSVRYDEVALCLPYDFSVSFICRRNIVDLNIDRDYLLSRLWTDGATGNYQRSWSIRCVGNDDTPNAGRISFTTSKTGNTSTRGVMSNAIIQPNKNYGIACSYHYINTTSARFRIYINGILDAEAITVQTFPFFSTAPFCVAALKYPTTSHYAACDISKIQYLNSEMSQADANLSCRGSKIDSATSRYWESISENEWVDELRGINMTHNATIKP